MIQLEALQTISGVAGTATAITWTLSLDEASTGVDAFKSPQGQLPTSVGTLYTAPASPAVALIRAIHLTNTTGSNVSGVKIYKGGTAATNLLWQGTIPANGSATYAVDGWKVYDSAGVQQYIGNTGPSGTIAVGTTSTLAPGSPATVANVGTSTAATFNFGIPAGAAATATAGTTTTGAPGTAAAVSNVGTTAAAVFNFTVPAGSVWRSGSGAPSNAVGLDGDYYLRTSNNDVYQRSAGVYAVITNLSGAVSSVTNSDGTVTVSGTIGNPIVSRAAITGDVGVPAGSNTATLANAGPGATGPIGSATAVPAVTIDAKGRVTGLTSTAIQIPESAVTNLTTDLGNKFDKLNGVLTGVASPTYANGKLVYDTDNDALTFFNSDNQISLQIGQEFWLRARNASGGSITNGAVVYISGSNTSLPSIALAQANAVGTSLGVGIATETIANNTTGFVTTNGMVRGLNTSGFAAGAVLYLSDTVAGGLTTTPPTNYRQRIGTVVVSDATNGTIFVAPGGSGQIATTLLAGLMSAPDKKKLDGLWFDVTSNSVATMVGDDSTLNDAAWTSIKAALPVGATVYFPAGTYRFANELTIDVDKRIQFKGAGRYTSIIKTTSATANIFNVSVPAWYNSWEDLGFQSSVTKTAGAAVAITSGSAVGTNVYRCWITGIFRGIDANGSQSGNLSVWSDLDISGIPNGGRGIKIQGDTINVQIHNTTINAGAATTSACCEINQSGAVQITSFDWIQGTNVCLINGTAGAGAQAVYFTNGFFDQPQGSVLKITGTTTSNRIKFTQVGIAPTGNNYAVEINGTGAGGVGTSTALPAGISIVDCDIYSQNGTNTSAGIFLNGVGDVNIQNTRITGFGGAGGCAIRCTPSAGNQTKLRVNGCILGPNSNLTVTNTIGVQIDAGASALGFLSITDNSMNGCGTAIIDSSASLSTAPKNIADNQGALAGYSAQAAPLSTALTTVETVFMVVPIPANAAKVGTTFRVTMNYKPAVASVVTMRARIGTSDVTPATNTCVQSIANASSVNASMTQAQYAVTVVGAAATFIGNGVINTGAVAQAVVNNAPAASGTFNSTVQNYLMITLQNTTSTTTTVHSGSVEVYSPA